MKYRLEFFTIMFAMNWGTDYILGKLLPVLSFFTQTKSKSMNANNHFNVTWTNGHILQFLWCTATKQRFSSSSCLGKYSDTQVLTVGPFLHQEQSRLKSWWIFSCNYLPNVFQCFIVMLLCSAFTDPVTFALTSTVVM